MSVEPRTERELLRALRAGDESAFEDAVARWTDLVYAACLRVLGRADAAEDAAQAVFLQLARKAPELGDETVLPAWLYRTAHFIARRAQTAAWRRARHEKEARKMRPTEAPAETARSDAWAEIAPRLDEALEALPEHYREVLVLHFLCGKKQREVAEALRLKESTVSMRVQRGLEKLRAKLLGREATVSAGAFGVLLGEHARALAPAHLPGAINAARKHGPVSPAVEELARQSLRAAARSGAASAWVLAAGGLLALGLLGWAGWALWKAPPATEAAAEAVRSAAPGTDAAPAPPGAPSAAPLDETWTFENGPPQGFEVKHGEWTWDRARGEMVCMEQTLVQLPVRMRGSPVHFEMWLRFNDASTRAQGTAAWLDASGLPGIHVWFRKAQVAPKAGELLHAESYFLERYKIQIFSGELQAVVRLDAEAVPDRLLMIGKQCRVRKIRVREIRLDGVPEACRDPQRLIAAGGFEAGVYPPVVLSARPEK